MYTNISGLTTSLDIHTLCMLAETAREIDIHSLLFSYILVLGRCGTKKVKALLKTLNTTQKNTFSLFAHRGGSVSIKLCNAKSLK